MSLLLEIGLDSSYTETRYNSLNRHRGKRGSLVISECRAERSGVPLAHWRRILSLNKTWPRPLDSKEKDGLLVHPGKA